MGEFDRTAAEADIITAVLRMLSSEYGRPYAHSSDDRDYAADHLLDAARRLVLARNGEDVMFSPAAPRYFDLRDPVQAEAATEEPWQL